MSRPDSIEMRWIVTHDRERNLISVESSGTLTVETVKGMIAEILKAADAYQCNRFLIDHRHADIQMSVSEIYNRPAEMNKLNLPSGWRLAILYSQKDAEVFHFYKNVTLNRGLPINVFTDADEATAWLIS